MNLLLAALCLLGVVQGMDVTVTAYTSSVRECDGDPWVTASGYRLKRGDAVVAVSRDLEAAGLKMGTWVYLALPQGGGWFRVEDRMHPRWRRRIDVWMGTSRREALAFGKRRGRIFFPAHVPQQNVCKQFAKERS